MASLQGVILKEGPPMNEVKNIFFKALNPVNYYAEEGDADAVENGVAFQYYNQALEASNKYGCLFLSYDNAFYLFRIKDVVTAAKDPNKEIVLFDNLKKLRVANSSLPVAPNVITVSNGEEYLAVDTIRGDSAWVVVFKLADFINQGGSCPPFCEIRCSPSANVRVRDLSWNPGENMSNLLAINVEDGSLFLAKVNGPSNVELNRFAGGDARCLCWSPKGKQLVIGKANGNLNQLKLDLSVAKEIPRPEPGSVPVSVLWTQTTQFLIVFQKDTMIDFMQLNLPKGAQPVYSNSGDIFISEVVPAKCSCYFLSFMPWNTVMAMTNSASDVVVLVKDANELWVPGDITDNRRAAFQLDHFARGATIYCGSSDPVTFSEVEAYPPMPIVFLLSQRGALSMYSIVNSDRDAPSLKVETTGTIPDSLFTPGAKPQPPQIQTTPAPQPPQFQTQQLQTQAPTAKPAQALPPQMPPPTFSFTQQQPPTVAGGLFGTSQPQQPLFKTPQAPQPIASTVPGQPQQQQPFLFSTPQPAPSKPQAVSAAPPAPAPTTTQMPKQPPPQTQTAQNQQVVQKLGGFTHQLPSDPRQLGTSTLPTAKDMAGLQKAVEEKRREMATQLQKQAELKGLEEDEQCAFVISEVRKFENRLADFVAKMDSSRINLSGVLNTSFSAIEKSVLSTLNVVEDFASDIESTTNAQREEVEILKERILNHFSQLEYAKSLVERSRDPRYLEHMRSRPLDPASQQKFEDVSKLHNYITNQIAECRGYFYEQSRKRDAAFDRTTYSQLIYLTLANHSKIIRRLKSELETIKERLGLGKHSNAFDEAEYLAVCDASYGGSKKESSLSGVLNTSHSEDITLTDLTAGISKVKLNQDSDRPDRKPIKFSNRKLLILKKCMSNVIVTKVKVDEASWTRSPSKSTRPKPLQQYPSQQMGTVETSSLNSMMKVPEPKSDLRVPSPNSLSKGILSVGSDLGCLTPDNSRHASFGSAAYPAMMNPTAVSFSGLGLGQGLAINNSKTSAPEVPEVPKPSPVPINQNPNPVSILKPFSQPQLPIQPSSGASAPVANVAKPSLVSTFSPSTQSPTLAGLLSTPPAASGTVPSGFSKPLTTLAGAQPANPSGGIFTSPAQAIGTGAAANAPTNLFSAGTGTGGLFNFGGQPPTIASVPSVSATTTPKSVVPTSTVSTSAPQVNFSFASALPTTKTATLRATPPLITLPPATTSINITPVPSSGGASAPSSFVLTQKTEGMPPTTMVFTFGSGNISSATSAPPKPITTTSTSTPVSTTISTAQAIQTPTPPPKVTSALPDLGTALNLSDTSGKTSTVPTSTTGTGSSGLFSFGSSTGAGTNLFGAPSNVVVGKTPIPSTTGNASTTTASSPAPVPVVTSASSSNAPVPPVSSVTVAPAVTTPSSNVTVSAPSPTPVSVTSPQITTSAPAITSTASSGLFSTSFVTPTTSTTSIFGGGGLTFGAPASVGGGGIFGAAPSTTTSSAPSVFGATATAAPTGLFSSTTTSASGGLFSSPVTSTVPSTTAPVTTSAPTGFMSALNLSDPSKSTTSASNVPLGLFSSAAFGSAATSPAPAANIFGGGAAFGANTTTTQAQGAFGSFGQAKPAATSASGIFGSPAAPAAQSVFGGAATFGSSAASSPFGSSFGGGATTASNTFGSPSGSIFGSAASPSSQPTGFGALTQQATTTSAFGSAAASPFGGAGQQQQTSVFGSPTQPKPGLFSTFGSPAAPSTGSIFGGSGNTSIFGQSSTPGTPGGAFSTGAAAGGVAQQGFGFGQAKPATGSAFGSPPAASPVFGGGATFGSTSPFGSSFAAPTASFGSGGSVFGGAAAAAPNSGFAALAQQTSPAFGGGTAFGSPQGVQPQQQQQTSLFGSPSQAQQPKPTFGGPAFSGWR